MQHEYDIKDSNGKNNMVSADQKQKEMPIMM